MASIKNFSYSTVAVAPSPATSGTSLTVSSGQGTLFAAGRPATIYPTGVPPLSSNAEIVTVSAVVGDVLTIVRAQESTSARTVVVGDQIAQCYTAATGNGYETTLAALQANTPAFVAKGDLIAGASAGVGGVVTVGADGTVLTADAASPDGVKWATPAGGGNVTGPGSAVDGNLAGFNGTSGTVIKDLGTPAVVIAGAAHAATGKTTPVDADELGLVDSAASNVLKKLTWANLKATAKTYFDTLYNSTITFGTGVLTALGVNVGTAGSVVVNGGALGTPSSGTATNLTGTAAGLTAGTVTTNANLTGDVTSSGNAATLAAGSASVLNSGTLLAARMPALTGDITTSAGAVATTLATVNSNVGTFGSATKASVVTVNAKGLVTAASESTVAPAVGSITGLGTGVATALAVNVGSAGALVTFNGALGTPSSGTLTNCTFPTLNQNTTGSAASLSVSGQTGLFTVTGLASTNRAKTVRDAADTILELGGSYTPTGTWTSLTCVTPVLGTPTSGTLTNCTGLPIATGVSGLGSGVATFLATASSANLAAAVTDETGSGVLVFGTDPALTVSTPTTTSFGYLGVPQNSKSAAYTTVMTDSGKHIYHPSADTTARTWTIDSNANVAYPIGTAITFINDTSGGVITIAITSDTLVLAGAGTTGNRTLAANGIATAVKMTSTRWIINGTGLT